MRIVNGGVVDIAAGAYTAYYLKADGSLWGFGRNHTGQLGLSGAEMSLAHVMIERQGVEKISSFGSHLLYSKGGGALWGLGNNSYGQLGDGTTVDRNESVLLENQGVVDFAAGWGSSYFVKTDGSLWSVGNNSYGQLGDGTTVDRNSSVKIVDSNVTAVRASRHVLFTKKDGSLWGFGWNMRGQLGDGNETNRLSPYRIVDSDVVEFACSIYGSIFRKTDGSIWVMGYNFDQLFGNQFADREEVLVPTKIWRDVKTHRAELNSTASLEMIWCPPGTFLMGSSETEVGRGTKETQHEVTLTTGFYLGKYEVTQAQYEAVMTGNTEGLSATPSYWPNPNRPVERVSWEDAKVFLSRLNVQQAEHLPEGWSYVLPTEAQWEYACRAGTNTAYSWGDVKNSSHANYIGSGFNQTREVGQYPSNSWGFHDMHGNLEEMTADWYDSHESVDRIDPIGPSSGWNGRRVSKSGSWNHPGDYARSAWRGAANPSGRPFYTGFRVCLRRLPADVARPELSLLGDSTITHLIDTEWVDPGVEAHDERDGNLTDLISVSGIIDLEAIGSYVLTYTVNDAAGNDANITRTINVVEGQAATHVAQLNSTVGLEMIWVKSGSFIMGQEVGQTETGHEVTLTNGFYLGKYEVTQAQYEAVMTGNTNGLNTKPSKWPNNQNRPVERVSWEDAKVFLSRLNEQQAEHLPEGWSYVLPTEAQWEYACRAGTTTRYSWGNTINLFDNANYSLAVGHTRDVGKYPANSWGFFDMAGNVWEWTADWYGPYGSEDQIDPKGPASGSTRILRGGCWNTTEWDLRSAARKSDFSTYRNDYGFRVALQRK